MSPPNRLRLLLVDDHTLFRDGVAELLAIEEDLDVVGRVGDSVAAVRMARETKPDTILLDVEMPYHPVSVTMRALRGAAPQARILILTMHDEPRLLQEVLAAGAHGALMKTATREELVGAIRAVGYHGKTVLSVSTRTAVELTLPTHSPLSPRELEVLELAARALSNAQIAAQLFIAEGTVKRHLTNIYAKLDAVSRLDAVNRARAAGLIQLADDVGESMPVLPEA
jgi:DNA-binding NarL/FixJ family response regulator